MTTNLNRHINTKSIALLLDGQKLFTDSFSMMLERYTHFASCESFNDVDSLVNFLANLKIHELTDICIFLEFHQKKVNGLSVLSEVRRISKKIKIIFVTSTTSPEVLRTIMLQQPDGIISKYSGLDILLECLRCILYENKTFYCTQVIALTNSLLLSKEITFTARELEVLKYFSEGYTIDQTAEATYLSRHTIASHRRNMMAKKNCNSIAQLVKLAKEQELI